MSQQQPTIGIVGAGIAGCSAAYFARKAFPGNTRIVVYERDKDIGGRIRSVMFADLLVELGATFVHSGNRILSDLLAELSLATKPAEGRDAGQRMTVGIWDGSRFVLNFSGSGPTTLARLALRYGLSLIRLRRLVDSVLASWNRIYKLQSMHHAFDSPAELLRAMDLPELMDETLADFLHKSGISRQICSDICAPICRAIFNQSTNINAFAGIVGLAGGNVGGGDVLSIRGGNYQLCKALLGAAKADVATNHQVDLLRHDASGGVAVVDKYGAETFDAVIIAAPLETAHIATSRPDESIMRPISRPLQTAHVTCVAGRLSPTAFGLRPDASLPRIILTTETGNIPFSAINPVGTSGTAMQYVYKLQSLERLDDQMIARLFERVDDILRVKWEAYPVLAPPGVQIPFVLDKGIYYTNCMESLVSTLETETVASKNVIELIRRDMREH